MKHHNHQLYRFTNFFSWLTQIVSHYAVLSNIIIIGGIYVFHGFYELPGFMAKYQLATMFLPVFLGCINIKLIKHFLKVDRQAPKNPTSSETGVFAMMNLLKFAAACFALLVGWKAATMMFFGINFWSFAPEYHWFFESRYYHGAMDEAKRAFYFTDHKAMFITIYASMTGFLVIVASAYSLMMRSVLVGRRNAYYMSLRGL
ncbi:hypothetical protein ABEH28_13510 [Pseudomonas sp. Ps21-P2]|uniref:hypothetical protein n=1 Tax=Pseudomonas sp. Ps21-P2 TaxID=3080331 RepID=UPI00320B5000